MRSKNAIYNVLSNLILQVVAVVYGFVIPRIIIGKFGSNVNGLISSITQFLAYITLLESGFGPVVKSVLYKPIASKDEKTICNILKTSEAFFRKISFIFIAYILCLCFFYPYVINNEFSSLYTISLIVIISISTFAEYFFGMTYRLFLQASQKSYVISVIQIVTYLISIAIIVALASFGFSVHIIKLAGGLIFTLRPIMQNLYVKKHFNLSFKDGETIRLEQKWDGLVQHIASVIHRNTDITLLTFFSTLNEVSVYAVYLLVVNGIKSIIQAFSNGIDALFGNMLANNEKENLVHKFNLYEVLYFSIITIVFVCTMVLITPFVKVYTAGITDANYVRVVFGYLIVISEYIWAIRLPYSSITLAAGHFKETRIGAWIECVSNILVSILLIGRYGIIGVAIGTTVAMTIRTVEFVHHTNKYILNRTEWYTVLKIIVLIFETIIAVLLGRHLLLFGGITYTSWILNGLLVFLTTTIIVCLINFVVYKKEVSEVKRILVNLLHKKAIKGK